MKRLFVAFVFASLAVAGMAPSCGGRTDKTATKAPVVEQPKLAGGDEVSFVEDEDLEGMKLRLREVGAPRDEQPRLAVAPGAQLTKAELDKLLARTEGFAAEIGDAKEFAMRPGSAPPPLTGKKVDLPFPPEIALKPPESGKPGTLEVIRFAPEGDVPIAPHLSLTFSRPMVAVTSQEEAAKTRPATVSPQPAGSWRWLGTRTLIFEPDKRFPMATDYAVEVPAGTASATGDKLKEAVKFAFTTPPPMIVGKFPQYGPRDIDPVIFVEFDQRIDANAIAEMTRLKHGGKSIALRVATDEEIAADDDVRDLVARAEKGRFAALTAGSKIPKGTHFDVVVKKGTPSAEGPKTTQKDQSFEFYTYSPLEIERSRCGWNDECPPTQDWSIEFNNPLDADAFDPTAIQIEPAVPGAVIRLWGDTINIGGMKQGRTRYTVTIPASTKDKFGQTLEKTEHVTFEVGPAEETLFGPGKELVTLDPSGPPKLAIHSINHDKLKVRIHKVSPADYGAWNEWRRNYRYETTKPGPLPGKRVSDRSVKVEGEPDRLAQTHVDLSKLVEKRHGHFIVHVEPAKQPKEKWRRQEVLVWVQVTDLGVTAFVDATEMLVWATRLADGKAVEGADAQLAPGSGIKGVTDGVGLARLALGSDPSKAQLLLVSTRDDAAFLPADEYGYWGGSGFQGSKPSPEARWYAFDDRGLYRPGEEVRVKGWIRAFDPAVHGDVGALPSKPEKISWKLRDSRGNDISKGDVKVSALAGFHVALTLPKEINLGTAWLELTAEGAGVSNTTFSHPIQIQEFRRPEFEVSADASPGPYVLGTEATASVSAKYYAGGGLPNAPVIWRAYAARADYTPPDRDEFQFGPWSPWWRFFGGGGAGGETATLEGKTDAIGDHRVAIRFEAVNPVRPMTVTAEATVTDVNRQAWTARRELLVHPADLYVGLKTARGFYPKGDPIEVEAIAVDLDGKAATGVALALEFARLEAMWKAGEWSEEELDVESCSVGSAEEPVKCSFHPKVGGTYRVRGTLRDAYGRRNLTEIRVWVEGGETPPSREVEQEKLTLVPEKEEYQPGETAALLVQSPFYPAEGVLTIRRSGLVREERFTMKGPTARLSVPILEEHIPSVFVQVDVTGAAVRSDDKGKPREDLPRRVAYATGSLTFKVPPLARTLSVKAEPRVKAIEPGGGTKIDLVVKGADGAPVKGAELVVVAADEAVLALTGYKLPNPIDVFYTARGAGVQDYHSRSQVLLTDPSALAVAEAGRMSMDNAPMAQSAMPPPSPMMAMPSAAPGGGEGGGAMRGMKMAESLMDEEASAERDKAPMKSKKASKGDMGGDDDGGGAIAVRTNFEALALFAPEVVTDAKGKATVDIKLPDSLTRYRIMVVAVEGGKRFGSGESNLTARLPLMARPSPPRFLNFGDVFELPVVLQNQTDKPMTVDVAVRATNVFIAKDRASAVPGTGKRGVTSSGRRVEVPANDRVEVRFPAASEKAGTARFEVIAASGASSDAARFELPVWTPATAEAFATYGEIDKGSLIQPVRAPGDVWPQFGGLEITTSSTQLQALTDAVLYLVSYPFDCNEQISSRVLAIAALRDVLSAFEAEGLPEPKELEELVKRDLAKLAARQNYDGGFSFWRKGDEGWPYLTIHVASALARAKAKGYEVPPLMWQRAERYLEDIERHIPAWYSMESRWMIRAYALHVLHLMGKSDAKKAKALLDEAGMKKLSFESLGFILPLLHAGGEADAVKQILRHMTNNATETAGAAHFVTGYTDGAHVLLHSDRRVDGIVLEALILVDPKNDLIPKVVRGLLAHKTRGKWLNTQENAFILLALDRYFNVYEKTTPDFVARVWLGENFAGEHAFKGRTTERAQIDVPMSFVAERKGDQPLVLQKDGKGRLYYRIGMRYAPKDLDLEAADYGFTVERSYAAIDDPADVKRDTDGTWRIRAGARVRVRLTMVAEARRYHVALIDPMPAGLEAVNPELATTEKLPVDKDKPEDKMTTRYWWWWRPWYEHENMRDERVEAFTSLLWDGVYNYSYVARATTPGAFVVPPARAEEMYSPETFGRSATDKVIVE
ncbi:MAG: Ig-like domain-containing protein [Proteobacteria bacterium]|jgi:hypothetical protein|nr:Ig-like domain-containing protein [Pseudomonadota bacterium]